jgi:RHS repeat-associated protein
MGVPGRKYIASADYRYGFNGKENDNEVKGAGNMQNYGFRIYDPRIAKFLSVDPLSNKYPELTPYQFASNCPIESIDLDGLEQLSKIVNHINVNDKRNLKDGEKWTNPLTGETLTVGDNVVTDEDMSPGSPYERHNEIQYTVTKTGAVNITSRTYLQTTKHTVLERKTATAWAMPTDKLSKADVPAVIKGIRSYLKQLGKDEVAVGVDIDISDVGLNKKELSQFKRSVASEIKKRYNIDVKFTTSQQTYTKNETDEKGKETGKKEQVSGVSVNVITDTVKLEDGAGPQENH